MIDGDRLPRHRHRPRGARRTRGSSASFNSWVQTGDPGPRATYAERLAFMRLHLRRLVEWKGNEKYGCVQFRKVATWYTRALRLPKRVQQKLVMLSTLAEFEDVIAAVRGRARAGGLERVRRAAGARRGARRADFALVKNRCVMRRSGLRCKISGSSGVYHRHVARQYLPGEPHDPASIARRVPAPSSGSIPWTRT